MLKMKKYAALLLALCLLAGCGAASSAPADPASSAPAEYQPTYTYQNPDPDMVMISAPGGDITFADYRLYLDVGEDISRYSARQTLAHAYLFEQDLKAMGIEIDEEECRTQSEQQLSLLALSSPSVLADMEAIAAHMGIADDELWQTMLMSYRTEYLAGLIQNHYYELAEAKYPAPEAPAESSEPPAQPDATPEDPGEEPVESSDAPAEPGEEPAAPDEPTPEELAEQQRLENVYNELNALLTEYTDTLDARVSYDDESVLLTLDGAAVPYTDEMRRFLDYAAIAGRNDAVSFIQAGELALRELERLEVSLAEDEAAFADNRAQYIEQMRADTLSVELITAFCAKYGATFDDYVKALERPQWLQTAGDRFYLTAIDAYNALPADAPDRPESADQHYVNEMDRLLEGSEIVNITGKAA